jgi:hypothetical protein
MRFYAFTNFYLSSIQKGIQAQHCTAELFTHYNRQSRGGKLLYDWAQNHKTTIVLNGGNCADLKNLFLSLRALCDELGFPYTSFQEDEQSLNGAITCVGVVLPARIYETASLMRTSSEVVDVPGEPLTWVEEQLIGILNNHSLAS